MRDKKELRNFICTTATVSAGAGILTAIMVNGILQNNVNSCVLSGVGMAILVGYGLLTGYEVKKTDRDTYSYAITIQPKCEKKSNKQKEKEMER